MKKDLMELVFVIDMSGSMEGLTDDTIGGFNSVLKEQKEKGNDVLVTTYLFNTESKMIHDRQPIADVAKMTVKDYRAGGCTALIDALGGAINHIADIHRYAREDDVPEHTLFVITTDGMENASHKYTADKVREMVKHEQEKYGWEFIYLAANIDAAETARSMGIRRENAVDYCADGEGTNMLYRTVGRAMDMQMNCCALKDCSDWREEIDADFVKRSRKGRK